jgi:hypothetical protein
MASRNITIHPGDTLRVDCVYNTLNRTAPTPMGYTTQQEMCVAFVAYWPKMTLDHEWCISFDHPQAGISGQCGATQFTGYQPPDFNEFTPPPCHHVPLDANATTPHIMAEPFDPTRYNRSQFLDPDEKYKLHWSLDRAQGIIHGAVEVDTTGWAGFGLSSFGMLGADVFIAWVDNDGNPHFADRFATARALPPIDEFQDYFDVQLMRTEAEASNEGQEINPTDIPTSVILGLAFIVSIIVLGIMVVCFPNLFTFNIFSSKFLR